ncbi:MAG: 4Fe-4S dicluster domain-containing protein [Mycobacterium leprae]
MSKGMLIDLTKCIGCRGCQVACKQWNDLPAEKTEYDTEFTNPQNRSAYTWTLVEFHTTERDGKPVSTFTKTQCMHCLEPGCESACIAKAITRDEATGAVVVNHDKCIGCRYCMVACPFHVPKYEYDKLFPKMQKCTMCYDRISAGMQPACAATCPNEAILFGDRDELLKTAKARIKKGNGKYVDHVYGEQEAGGTAVLYISGAPLELTALNTKVTTDEVPSYTWKAMKQLPFLLGAVGAVSLGLRAYSNRRAKIEEEAVATKEESR